MRNGINYHEPGGLKKGVFCLFVCCCCVCCDRLLCLTCNDRVSSSYRSFYHGSGGLYDTIKDGFDSPGAVCVRVAVAVAVCCCYVFCAVFLVIFRFLFKHVSWKRFCLLPPPPPLVSSYGAPLCVCACVCVFLCIRVLHVRVHVCVVQAARVCFVLFCFFSHVKGGGGGRGIGGG